MVTTGRKSEYCRPSIGTLLPLPLGTDVVCLQGSILFLVTTILTHCRKCKKALANGLPLQFMLSNPHSSHQTVMYVMSSWNDLISHNISTTEGFHALVQKTQLNSSLPRLPCPLQEAKQDHNNGTWERVWPVFTSWSKYSVIKHCLPSPGGSRESLDSLL